MLARSQKIVIGRRIGALGRLARLMELPKDPSILVLLVATDGAVWLPDVLKGLRAQQYRPIKVLAVDNASGDGSGAILAKAFGVRRVVTLERRIGYGRALAADAASAIPIVCMGPPAIMVS